MNRRIIGNLYRKEILDVLRDKKTVLMMIVVPIIIYPLLIIVGMQLMTSISRDITTHTYVVAFGGDKEIDKELIQKFSEVDGDYSFQLVKVDDYQESLAKEEIDAYVFVSSRDVDGKDSYSIHYLSAVNNSSYAAGFVEEVLNRYSNSLTVELLEERGLPSDYILNPIDISFEDNATGEETAGNILGMILPFMLVVSLLLGTMYPAIDTTAGERERGTLETILTLPVSNRQLIVSKFLAVATIGIVSAVLNVLSMVGVGAYMYSLMKDSLGMSDNISMERFVPAIVVGALCVLAFAIFISACTMCVCAFAKTYKEANNYITPLTLVVLFATFVGFLPNIQLNQKMALMPVANICLLIKDLLAFKYNIGIIAIVLVSNVAYGIMAVLVLGKIYNSETILFGDSINALQIFEKRSNMKKGGKPTTGDTWMVIAVTAVAIIYIGSMAQLNMGVGGVVITQLIIIGIPLFAAWYSKRSIRDTFKLRGCKAGALAGGIFLILGTIMLGMILTALTSSIFRESAENVDISMEYLLGDKFWLTLVVVAVTPAICEEAMFRGYILSSMENRYKANQAVMITAILFGLYHMSIVKFFTTALLGYSISYVANRTKSILPGMLMHFINNALSCVVMYYPSQIEKLFPVLIKTSISLFDFVALLGLGMIFVGIGIFLILKSTKNKEEGLNLL
ncbi:MAG: ABC transporter permease subunit/CPBP intramembrane protease [Wujia sp.]